MTRPRLPDEVALVRVTDEWDAVTMPDGLRRAHRVAEGVWGRLVVRAGAIRLTFEDDDSVVAVAAGESAVLPPTRPHRVEPIGAVRFTVEFFRVPS